MTETHEIKGAVFYDAHCRLCCAFADRCRPALCKRGFDVIPFPAPGARERLGMAPGALLDEMRLITPGGETLGGADAVLHIAQFIWWGRPLRWIAAIPGGRSLLRRGYRWVAAHRTCADGLCAIHRWPAWPGWAPLLCLPVVAIAAMWRREPWLLMWALAVAIYAGCKWLTWWDAAAAMPRVPLGRSAAYLCLWPGMDAISFLGPRSEPHLPPIAHWPAALAKTAAGALLLWGVARCVPPGHPVLAGWVGMLGLIFLLHFGAFHLLALFWQAMGIQARPLMRMPIAARSLGEFWSVRWNRGFNDLVRKHMFVPLRRRLGMTAASLTTFLASGLVHELVISVPARGGYGLPTLYFFLQGLGILAEHSRAGDLAGLHRGIRGRLFTITVVAGPAYWLFHPPFVLRVIIPFLHVIKAL
jgi:predicted DCC family thiol-disulfide oxidoreductase YuxK